jgi:anti-anti-sigma factor
MALPQKTIDVEEKGDTLIVIPIGDSVSFRQADVYRDIQHILTLIQEKTYKKVLVDLNSRAYFGSMIIGAINSMSQEVKKNQGQIALCQVSDTMREVLTAMNLHQHWPMLPDRKTALKVLSVWK